MEQLMWEEASHRQAHKKQKGLPAGLLPKEGRTLPGGKGMRLVQCLGCQMGMPGDLAEFRHQRKMPQEGKQL